MPADEALIRRQMAQPSVLRLHRALSRLKSTVTLLDTGAHPDDESSAMLAALSLRDGVRVVLLCSTRGEGGQNAIGPERGGDLAALRSREMEEAARVLDAGVTWIGHGPDDPVHDFGFSKSGVDTLRRWGHERAVERLVRAIRTERPDIVIPTFLDVPGQHGHHRAMTQASREAVELAGDPAAFPEHAAAGLAPWSAAKFYLPAWSGKSASYDDDLPPPEATVTVQAGDRDPVTGATHAQIGQWSRLAHRTQGMGVWREAAQSPWPLHRAYAVPGMPAVEATIMDGLPATVASLADTVDDITCQAGLRTAQAAIDRAIAVWPHSDAVAAAAAEALTAIRAVLASRPEQAASVLDHRLQRKARELEQVLFVASGLDVRAFAEPAEIVPGGTLSITAVRAADTSATEIALAPRLPGGWAWETDSTTGGFRIHVPGDAPITLPFAPGFDPLGGNGLVSVEVAFALAGVRATATIDLDEPVRVLPAALVTPAFDAIVVNLARPSAPRPLGLRLQSLRGTATAQRKVGITAPAGWEASGPGPVEVPGNAGVASIETVLTPPAATGLHEAVVTIDGQPGWSVRRMQYPHLGTVVRAAPAILRLRTLEVALPDGVRVGVVGGGSDRADAWLRQVGLAVDPIDAETLTSGELGAWDTILVGVFAFRTRPELAAATTRLHRWVRDGGHLVTLYHRPIGAWVPQSTPLAPLTIGHPSYRWRVTDPAAPVQMLRPEHPLLAGPNPIGEADWAGWDKERGLYFASGWDPAYEALLAIGDPGETPLEGGLLSGRFGQGRHTHVTLALHHQLDRLVPGAFRLMANLMQRA
jgi:LmbE family N-acetylglucosaminyl deacetylase